MELNAQIFFVQIFADFFFADFHRFSWKMRHFAGADFGRKLLIFAENGRKLPRNPFVKI